MSRKNKASKQKQPVKAKSAAPVQPPSGNAASNIPAGGGPKIPLLRIAQLLFAVALIISIYLAYTSLSAGQLAGCGAGSDCDNVLSSRWAYWFKLPVSVPAVSFYLLLLTASVVASPARNVATQRKAWIVLVAGAFAVLGAALWFIGLQAMIIGSWCKFCMAAHALGGTGAVLVLVAAPFVIRSGKEKPALFGVSHRAWPAMLGMLMLVPLVMGQYLSTPPSATIVKSDATNIEVEAPAEVTESTAPDVEPEEPSRIFSLLDGRFKFDLYSVPLLGSPEAPHVMISLFDYTCSHCRTMHERLVRVQNQYSNELAIVLMPMPLDSTCNRLLTRTGPDHVNACQYARIALALFKEREDVFNEFEDWFFETPKPRPLADVRQKASEWSGKADFDSVINHPGIEAWIQLGIQVFQANMQKSGQQVLPMIMAGPGIMAGKVENDEALINFLVENLGMKRLPAATVLPAPDTEP